MCSSQRCTLHIWKTCLLSGYVIGAWIISGLNSYPKKKNKWVGNKFSRSFYGARNITIRIYITIFSWSKQHLLNIAATVTLNFLITHKFYIPTKSHCHLIHIDIMEILYTLNFLVLNSFVIFLHYAANMNKCQNLTTKEINHTYKNLRKAKIVNKGKHPVSEKPVWFIARDIDVDGAVTNGACGDKPISTT